MCSRIKSQNFVMLPLHSNKWFRLLRKMIAVLVLLLIRALLPVNGITTSSSENSNATTFQAEAPLAASNSTDPISIYLEKICNGEPTCHLIDQVPSRLRSLEIRDCMCDAESSTYGDCCLDSKYYNETEQRIDFRKFFCMPLFRIYALVTCPSTFTNAEVKSKCELSKIWPPKNGTTFQIPVTNTELDQTYGNQHGALCNSVSKFRAYNLTYVCKCEIVETADDMKLIFVDAKHGSFNLAKNKFVGFLNDSECECMPTSRLRNSPNLKLRSCIDGISTCPPGNESNLCESQTAFVYTYSYPPKIYRKKHCAECNGETVKLTHCRTGSFHRSKFSNLVRWQPPITGDCRNLSDPNVKSKYCPQ